MCQPFGVVEFYWDLADVLLIYPLVILEQRKGELSTEFYSSFWLSWLRLEVWRIWLASWCLLCMTYNGLCLTWLSNPRAAGCLKPRVTRLLIHLFLFFNPSFYSFLYLLIALSHSHQLPCYLSYDPSTSTRVAKTDVEERTRMMMRSENWYSRKMVRVSAW